MRMLWARQTKLGLAIETTLRRAKPRCPWDLAHWVADPPERPTVADVSAVLAAMLERPAPPVTWPKGIPDLSAIKLTMARQVRSALAESDDHGALDGMRDLAAVDMADGTTYAAFLSLLQATNGSVLAAARSAIRPRVVMHVSCLPRLDRARRSAGSFAVAESRGVSQVLVVGAPDNDQFLFDASSNVLTVPAPDTYEHLPEKVVAALTFLSMGGNVEAVLKVDDDHRLKSWGELERGFHLVQRVRPQQIGKLTDVGWPGMHRRAWHFGKCSDAARNEAVYTFPGPTRWANGASGYFLNAGALRLMRWSYVYFSEYIESGLYEDLVISELMQRQCGVVGPFEMSRILADEPSY